MQAEVERRAGLARHLCALARQADELRNEAMMHARACVQLAPEVPENWYMLGEVALSSGHKYFYDAIAALEKAISLRASANGYALLGFAYDKIGKRGLAIENLELAVDLDPELGLAHFLLSTLYSCDEFDPAKQAFHGERGLIAKKPAATASESRWAAANGYLTLGDYARGWTYFESRLERNATNLGEVLASERSTVPMWRGEKNCRVLISAEGGYGDNFLMARYLPLLKERFGVDAQFECQPAMLDLMRCNFPEIHCIPFGEADEASFEYHLPMLSLPLIFQTQSDSVPWDGPYITAEATLIGDWRKRLPAGPNVGICWHTAHHDWSAENHETCKRKSIPFEKIMPLLEIPGLNFISLQVGNDKDLPNPGILDFSDTAAIISLCDVVISVDTAVANLAGAMGANLWLLDRYDHCWRWSSIATPWYPTATIFRQQNAGAWGPVIDQAGIALIVRRFQTSKKGAAQGL